MSDYVTLIGSEQVQSAGVNMRDAANNMKHAADQIDTSIRDLKIFLEDWLSRFEQAVAHMN